MSNFNNTGEVKEISILDMMNGAIGERVAYELTRIMKNCRDFNTEAKKARTLTIKLSIVPTENRDSVAVRAEVSTVSWFRSSRSTAHCCSAVRMQNPSLWSTRRRCPVSSRSTRPLTPNPRSSSWRKSQGGFSK